MRLSIVHLILSLSAATATTAAAAAGVRRTETDTTKLEAELATVEELEAETEQLITELERTDGTTLDGGDGIVAPQIEPYPLPYEEEPIDEYVACNSFTNLTDPCPDGQVIFSFDGTRTKCKCIDEPIDEYVECNSFTDLTHPCPDGQVIFSLDDTRTKCKCIDHVKVPCENITCTEPGYKVEEFYHTEITSENSTTTCKRSCVPINCTDTEDKMECHGEILIRDPLLNCEFPKCLDKCPTCPTGFVQINDITCKNLEDGSCICDTDIMCESEQKPSSAPSSGPSESPSSAPTSDPSKSPSSQPSSSPSSTPSLAPTESPSSETSSDPSSQPSRQPSRGPTKARGRGGGRGNGGNGGGKKDRDTTTDGKKGGKKRNLRAAA